ncbi:serine/arginine repetitive matrix protein 1-like [Rattus rattus]|uniref:serine/arginine repetitive matrix protein 1-like n=1 Tax=Rattus rattus TaxID=10117 RepID=UPI0013F3869A|nr:serine/arginine repetitive matrix protein 1-like [Rattus rattus]
MRPLSRGRASEPAPQAEGRRASAARSRSGGGEGRARRARGPERGGRCPCSPPTHERPAARWPGTVLAESRVSQRSIAAAYTPSPSSAARPAQPPPRPAHAQPRRAGAAHAPVAQASRSPARGRGLSVPRSSSPGTAPSYAGARSPGRPRSPARPRRPQPSPELLGFKLVPSITSYLPIARHQLLQVPQHCFSQLLGRNCPSRGRLGEAECPDALGGTEPGGFQRSPDKSDCTAEGMGPQKQQAQAERQVSNSQHNAMSTTPLCISVSTSFI